MKILRNILIVLIIAVVVSTSAFVAIESMKNRDADNTTEGTLSETKSADATMHFSETVSVATGNTSSSETVNAVTGSDIISQSNSTNNNTTEQSVSIGNKVDTTKESAGTTAKPKKSESGRIIVDPKSENWNLIVVSGTREIPKGYEPKLKEILGCGKYLDYRVAPHYEDMYYAAKKDGITLVPYSAYRSYERQETNYNSLTNQYMTQYSLSRKEAAKKAATVILPPGTSEHNLGISMDICNTYNTFANSKEFKWLTENAHKYGFILRYTAEKQPITGIVPEPWHWRYVGVEYAEKIKDSGLCLEEYLDSIGVAY